MQTEVSHQLPGGSPRRPRPRRPFALGAPRAFVAPVEGALEAARVLARAALASAYAVEGRNLTLVAHAGDGEPRETRLAARALAHGTELRETGEGRWTLAIPVALAPPAASERRRIRPRGSLASAALVLEGEGEGPAPALTPDATAALARALLAAIEARAFAAAVATDASTGALSRSAFESAAASELGAAQAGERAAALVLVEVVSRSRATEVEAAEEAMASAAEALRAALRAEDLVARRGPDELAALLLDADPVSLAPTLDRIARALAAAVEPFGLPAPVLGAASLPGHGTTLEEIDVAALAALESARSLGPGSARVFDPALGRSPTAPRRSFFTGDPGLDARKANLLFESILAANAAREPADALDAVLRALAAATSADRVAILAGGAHALEPSAARDHDGHDIVRPFRFSKSACLRALASGRAVFVADTTTAGEGATPSVLDLHLRSVVAVPLLGREGSLGVLYADSTRPSARRHGPEALAYLEALAAQAAIAIENANLRERLEEENQALKREVRERLGSPRLLGTSPAFRQATRHLPEVVESDGSVLLLGESGTGKELLARTIHELSPRAKGTFVAQNCAAIPAELLESELFGHAAGAFSGATRAKRGLLEIADGGTFFLDEIADLPLSLQAKLLRVLEDKEVRRVGETRGKRIDFRLVSATNRDLAGMVETGGFRRDLFYRINVFTITLPPLRERTEDIEDLARHFLARACERLGRPQPVLSPEALAVLKASPWPGNVRELANVMEKAAAIARSGRIDPEHVGVEPPAGAAAGPGSLRQALAAVEARMLAEALRANDGNVSRAARALGVARQQMQRLMKRYDLRSRQRP